MHIEGCRFVYEVKTQESMLRPYMSCLAVSLLTYLSSWSTKARLTMTMCLIFEIRGSGYLTMMINSIGKLDKTHHDQKTRLSLREESSRSQTLGRFLLEQVRIESSVVGGGATW